MRRTFGRTSGFLLAGLLMAAPASAQAVQSFHLSGGWFMPKGFDGRDKNDVLVADLTNQGTVARENCGTVANPRPCSDALEFAIKDFRTGTIAGEWTLTFNDRVEIGAGVAFLRRSVPSVYVDLVNSARGNSEIAQTLTLRMVPITGVVRFLPFGSARSAQPYIGAGFGSVRFRYSEIGEFVDPTDFRIFEERYIAQGNAPAALFLVGLRAPVGGDIYALNLEYRYQSAVGNTGGSANGFISDKIDLSGGSFTFGFQVRF